MVLIFIKYIIHSYNIFILLVCEKNVNPNDDELAVEFFCLERVKDSKYLVVKKSDTIPYNAFITQKKGGLKHEIGEDINHWHPKSWLIMEKVFYFKYFNYIIYY